MGISITDIVALAKAGYTPGQVKELITLSETSQQTQPEEQQGAAAAPIEPTTASPEPVKAPENVAAAEPVKEEINYKELYEKSQEDLKKAQEVNRKTDASPIDPVSPEKELKDLFASFV